MSFSPPVKVLKISGPGKMTKLLTFNTPVRNNYAKRQSCKIKIYIKIHSQKPVTPLNPEDLENKKQSMVYQQPIHCYMLCTRKIILATYVWVRVCVERKQKKGKCKQSWLDFINYLHGTLFSPQESRLSFILINHASTTTTSSARL